MNRLYSRLHAIRRSRDGTGGSGGRQKAALARLHSARSLNRSQGFTAGCRGSSLAPLGRRSSIEKAIIKFENNPATKTVTMFAEPEIAPVGVIEQAKQQGEWANAQVTFTAAEFQAAPDKADFLRTKAMECAEKTPFWPFFDYATDLARLIEKAEAQAK